MNKEYEVNSLATFIRFYYKDIRNFITNYIYLNTGYTSEVCRNYANMAESFLELYDKEFRKQPTMIIKKILEVWFSEHQISVEGIQVLENAMDKGIEEFCNDSMDMRAIQEELNTLFDIINYVIKISDIKFSGYYPKNKAYSLIEIVDIFITQQGDSAIAHTLKKLEELFSFKRSSYYSFDPNTYEIIGVFGQELSEVKHIKTTIFSQKPFELAYQSKKMIFISDAKLHFDEDLVKRLQLVSLVIIPVYFESRFFGWIVLDNVAEKFAQPTESLYILEEIGQLLAVYINKCGLHEYKQDTAALSSREKDVLLLLAEGFDNKKIGMELHLSEHTVRDNISQLMLKLSAKNRTHLVAIALRNHLIS